MVREVETKLRHGGGEVCHVSTNYTICSRSEALDLKNEELRIRIKVCRVKIHRRCLKLAAIKGCKTCVPLVVWPGWRRLFRHRKFIRKLSLHFNFISTKAHDGIVIELMEIRSSLCTLWLVI